VRRSQPSKHAAQRFGRHVSTIGARQGGADLRFARAQHLAMLAKSAGSAAGAQAIYARRLNSGKRV
jgi:hypothetical protein